MSTRSTIILTAQNEHWYRDCNSQYNEDTKTLRGIVLEFDKIHRVETDEEGTRIIIEEDTELYNELIKLFGH